MIDIVQVYAYAYVYVYFHIHVIRILAPDLYV